MLKELFNQYLEKNNYGANTPQELYQPIDYILSLGGKRIRPLSVLMACALFDKQIEKALPAAYAIEIFHNFSLVHDDIMDNSQLRRGQATVHKKWGDNTAILSGDVMLVYAYEHLSKIPVEILPQILKTFNEVAIGVCEGQQMDMNFETRAAASVSVDEYIRMIELKTSVLICGAMKIGALIGGATLEQAELVGEFGRNLGIAFQLQDDYLDTFGETAKVGKRIGGDIIQNKKNYLVIKALQLADEDTRQLLLHFLSETVPEAEEAIKIKEVTHVFRQLDIPTVTQDAIKYYNDLALKNLEDLDIAEEDKEPLLGLVQQLMVREC